MAKFCNKKYAAALSSGTAAIHLALIMLGIEHGDEVIVSSFTFSASANPIVYQGATPVFIDSEPETWNMDPLLLEESINDRILKGKKPKAIIVVHLYGMPANMDRILEISKKYDIAVIEDAAEALGSRFKNNPSGSFGTMSVISFNGNKIITTSGGGILLSNNLDYINKARFLATQARDKAPHYQHSSIGYNYRMSNIVAGIGRGQMEVITERVEKKREINSWYKRNLNNNPGVSFQTEPSQDYFSNYWLTCLVIEPELTGTDREEIRLSLEDANNRGKAALETLHLQPVFAEAPRYLNGISEICLIKAYVSHQEQKCLQII